MSKLILTLLTALTLSSCNTIKPTVEGLADEAKVNGSVDAKIGQTDNGYGASVGASTKIYRVKPYFNIGIGFSWVPKAITPLPEDPLPLPTK